MQLTDTIFKAGIVGCGGAGFPTHAKYQGGQIETVIINGTECEPLLQTDKYLMRNRAADIIRALDWIVQESGAKEGIIALKKNYKRECEALLEAIRQQGSSVHLHLMESYYPAGDEQAIVFEVTGKVVPPAGIPLHVGCVVDNIATVCCIADAMAGNPFTEKYITVTGEVRSPAVLKVPLGTPVKMCIELAGGVTVDHYAVINGGPMMGKLIENGQVENSFVTKTMSGLIVVPADSSYVKSHQISVAHMINRAKSSCIQCSLCTQFCPRALLGHPLKPHMIMRRVSNSKNLQELLDDAEIRNAAICCECGICETYACPMGLQPRRMNALLKKELAGAGIRYQRPEGEWDALPERELRKAPTSRVAARAGVSAYMDKKAEKLICISEEDQSYVRLALRQGIGKPSVPVVQDGESVTVGQVIAVCQEGQLGSVLHASIGGIVKVHQDDIEIWNKKGVRD